MPVYVKECKKKYVKGDEMGHVACVYSGVKNHAGEEELAERGIRASLRLAQKRGPSTPITVDELSEQSGINPDQTPTLGLWPWLQAGIVGFVFRDNFYSAIQKVLDEHD
jgi:hypothetical protein